MPVATRKQETIRHDLKSCEGGFVVLRQLSYDEMLERRDGATQILMERGVAKTDAAPQMAIKIANKWSNQFSFPRCIIEHNLDDEKGNRLDFSKPAEVFKTLDPKVGAEIEALIDELNQEAEEKEDFTPVSDSSSQNGQSSPQNDSEQS
jgi:hypothetical protein